jgi:hypothetical protein
MFGYEFELLDRRLAWSEDRVYFHDKNGTVIRMPTTWTSVGEVDPFVALSAGRSHFRVTDLLQLVDLMGRLLEEASKEGGGKV